MVSVIRYFDVEMVDLITQSREAVLLANELVGTYHQISQQRQYQEGDRQLVLDSVEEQYHPIHP